MCRSRLRSDEAMSTFDLMLFVLIVALMTFAPILIALLAQKLAVQVKQRSEAPSQIHRIHRRELPRPAEHAHPHGSLEVLHPRLSPLEIVEHEPLTSDELAPRSRVSGRSPPLRKAVVKQSTCASRPILRRPLDVRRAIVMVILLGPPRSIDPH